MKNFNLNITSSLYILLSLTTASALAANKDYTVKKIQLEKNTIYIESHTDEKIEPGEAFSVSDEMENKCTILINKAKNKLGLGSIADCSIKDQLQVGQPVEKEASEESPKSANKKGKAHKGQRSITDLSLFPNDGQFLVSETLDIITQNRVQKLNNLNYATADTSQTNSSTDVYYGFLKDFYAKFTFAYQLAYQDDVQYIGSSKTTEKRDGMFNPSFEFGYRLMESKEMSFDANLGYTMDMNDFKEGYNNKSGTPAAGKSIVSPGAHFQYKMPSLLLGAAFTYNMNSEQKSKAVDGTYTRKVTGGDNMTLLLSAKYFVTPSLNAYAAFRYDMIMDSTDTVTSTITTVSKTKAFSPMSLILGGQYMIFHERLAVFASYNYLLSGDYTVNTSNTDYTITNSRSVISLGLQATF